MNINGLGGYSANADGVLNAANRLNGVCVRTPLIENAVLNELMGGRIFLKAEVLQYCGAFKFRGAYNLISQLSDEQKKTGVVAWSSGNHAQGIALAAKMFNVPATIVMPEDAPEIKASMVRRLGAEIVAYDRYSQDREAIAYALAEKRGAVIAPSFDHPHIIEGQGSLAVEAVAQAAEFGVTFDDFVACCGGGGLAAGCALGLSATSPQTTIKIAEPIGFDDTLRSLDGGERVSADVSKPTICDAIATPMPGALTFPILKQFGASGAAVTEADIVAAMKFAFNHLKLIVEPGGAAALAAILSGKIAADKRTMCVTLSGGNVDLENFTKILSTAKDIA